jgi:serine/threonine protein kinase
MAPEVMQGQNHTYTADYYAIGIITYELLLKKRPYNSGTK